MAASVVMDAVEARIAAFWATSPWSATPLDTPNPEEGSVPKGNVPFLSVSYPVADDQQISIGDPGNNVFREIGAFRIVLSVPIGSGRQVYTAWLDTLRANLRNAEFDGVRCWAPNSVTTNDQSDNRAYFELSFATAYWHDFLA